MSLNIIREAWQLSRADGSALLLLLAIADNANDETREAWPSIPYLADKCRCSERWVRYLITQLEELGEVEVSKRPTGGNLYRVTDYNGLNWREQKYPALGGDIKDPERQRAITANRPRRRRRPSPKRRLA